MPRELLKIFNFLFMKIKKQKIIQSLSIAAFGIFMFTLGFNYSQTESLAAALTFKNFAKEFQKVIPTYDLYKAFFTLVDSGAGSKKSIPAELQEKIKPYYKNSLSSIRIAATSNFADNWAITDCNNIYVGGSFGKDFVKALTENKLSPAQTRLLLHELAHSEQCDASGRKKYAETWFKQVQSTLLSNPNGNIRTIHNAMPMEKNAETKAQETLPKINS